MANLNAILAPTFDSSTVEPSTNDGTPLPVGIYTVEITDSELKPLKSGNGTGLQVEFTVIDPAAHAKRKVWANLNLQHTNAQAQEIGQRDFGLLCQAVGIRRPDDTDELFGKILKISTKIRPADGQYAAKTEVKGYMAAGVAAHGHAAPAASAPAKAAPPWAVKRA